MGSLINLLLTSKGVKIGGLLSGSGGAIALVFALHQDIKSEIVQAEVRSKQFSVDATKTIKSEFGQKLDYIQQNQRELKDLVKTIDNRLYNLNKKQNQTN